MHFKREKWCDILPALEISKETVREIAQAWTKRYNLNTNYINVEYYWNGLLGLVAVIGKDNHYLWEQVLGYTLDMYHDYSGWDFKKGIGYRFYYNADGELVEEKIQPRQA